MKIEDLGQVVSTGGIAEYISEYPEYKKEILRCVGRYIDEDWGDMCKEDMELNDSAVKNGDDRILAKYKTSKGGIYIITEWDRSVTTILFTHEY